MKPSTLLASLGLSVALLGAWPINSHAFGEKMPEGFTAEKAGVSAEDLGRQGQDEIRAAWARLGASTLLDLNLRAAGFWQHLVACQEGNAESARQAYLGGERLCLNDATDLELKAELGKLTQDFQTLLIATPLPAPNSLDWRQTMPFIHPFLAELAIESLATVHHEVQARYRDPSSGKLRRPITSFHLPSRLQCFPDPADAPTKAAVHPCGPGSEHWERIYWNAKRILAVPSNPYAVRGCARFGLWPNASLATSAIFNYYTGRSEIHDYRGVAYSGRVPADGLSPSCWMQGTREVMLHMNGNWMDSTRDRSTLDATLRHAEFIDEINARYVKIRQSWQKHSLIQQSAPAN